MTEHQEAPEGASKREAPSAIRASARQEAPKEVRTSMPGPRDSENEHSHDHGLHAPRAQAKFLSSAETNC